jgi:hypothetical protein
MKPALLTGIFPLLEAHVPTKKEQDKAITSNDIMPRLAWLLNVSTSSTQSFFLQWRHQEPPAPSFYALQAVVLTLDDKDARARWVQLERRACRKKITLHRAHLRRLCTYYGICYEKDKQEHRFKFPHKDGWLLVEEGAIEETLAQNAFPGALSQARYVGCGAAAAGVADEVRTYLSEHPSKSKTQTRTNNKKLKV